MEKPRYFYLIYDTQKMTEDKTKNLFDTAQDVVSDNPKVVVAGWEKDANVLNNGWHNIKEYGYPPHSDQYLVYDGSDVWVSLYRTDGFDIRHNRITHWQYLPDEPLE